LKAIIEGKRYNTETAVKLGEASNGLSYSDFSHWEEALYVTSKGAYFTAGGGGPMTKYATAAQGGGTGGSVGIFPLTQAEAFEWAQEHMSVKEVMAAFGSLVEEA